VTRRVRDIPPAVQAALRNVHRLLREHRPYSEMSAALDGVAALPEASHPGATEAIALERLDLIGRCAATDEEVEGVLEQHADVLAAMPTHERASKLRNACWQRRALAERYLTPLLAEVEQREPEDRNRTAEILRHALAVARGETQPEQLVEDASAGQVPEEYLDGIRDVLRLASMAWPYEAVVAALDELTARPGAVEYEGLLMRDRLILANWYERPDEELDGLLQTALRVFEGEPARSRLSTVSSACVGRPALAAKYVPPLIAEFEEDLRRNPDQVGGEQELEVVRRSYERTMVKE
jgi:hypothetical protein